MSIIEKNKQLRKCGKIWAIAFAISFAGNILQFVTPIIIKHNLKEEQKIAQIQCHEENIPIDGPALALPESLEGKE